MNGLASKSSLASDFDGLGLILMLYALWMVRLIDDEWYVRLNDIDDIYASFMLYALWMVWVLTKNMLIFWLS